MDHGTPVPDVDLLIRTGGERRLSDFLLWEAAYAELLFTPLMWPEFGPEALRQAVRDFAAGSVASAACPTPRPADDAARTRQGLAVLSAALALGVVADVLGRLVPARLDVALGLAALVLALLALAQCGSATLPDLAGAAGRAAGAAGRRPHLARLSDAVRPQPARRASPSRRWPPRGFAPSDVGARAWETTRVGAGELGAAGAAGAAALVLRDIDWASLPIEGRARRARGAASGWRRRCRSRPCSAGC